MRCSSAPAAVRTFGAIRSRMRTMLVICWLSAVFQVPSKQRIKRLSTSQPPDPLANPIAKGVVRVNTARCQGSREGDGVAHVGEAGDVGEGALEAEAEAGVRHRAVAAQIAVPGVMLPVDGALGHIAVQYFEPLLALAAADDFADPGCEHVHRRDRPPVVVHPHLEGL